MRNFPSTGNIYIYITAIVTKVTVIMVNIRCYENNYIFFSVLSRLELSSTKVYLGRHSQSGLNPNEVTQTLKNIVCHPDYNPSTNENDICLLKLSAPVNFTDYIQPICLASENSTFYSGTSSWVTGFGTTASKLQKI